MNWIPIYIVGREGFEKAVQHALKHSQISFMPGYLKDELQPGEHAMYWIDQSVDMQQLKRAITARVVFKYRLRIFNELDDFIQQHPHIDEMPLAEVDY